FQQNRWRFVQRTTTAQPPGKDFSTWDLPRIMAEIDLHFTIALSGSDQFRRIPVSDFDALLQAGTIPDKYRPTLYEFIAHEALKFYSAGEQAAGKPQDPFEISTGDPIFGTIEEFLAWNPKTTETNSPTLKAVRLYQQILQFHRR